MALGFGVSAYGRFDLDDPRSALISNDWVVGLDLNADLGRWEMAAQLYHESSHLGDEYRDTFNVPRLDWTREQAVGWARYHAGPVLLSGAVSWVLIDALDVGRGGAILAADYRGWSGRFLGQRARAVAGLYTDAAAATNWKLSGSARLGVAFSGKRDGRELGLALIAHDGLSTQRQFFRARSRYVGVELRFDL